jgi:2-keto-3-deoxy-L-rhamnonate aldolase RhmA
MGVIVPRIHSAAEGRAAIDAMKFPPLGNRGYGLGSIVTDLKASSAQDELNSANRETLVVLMIESKQGLESVEEIAAIPDLDVLFLGPYDLSLSLGIVEQFESPIFTGALDSIFKAAAAAGVAVGLQSPDISLLRRSHEKGARFLIYGSDLSVLLNGYRSAISQLKG